MAGLLQKLNKRPRRKGRDLTSTRIVLPDRVNTESGVSILTQESTHEIPSPTPATSSSAPHQGSGITQELARQSLDALPWWISSPPHASPKVDLLVPIARGLMNQELKKEILDEDEYRKILRKAVQTAAGALPSTELLSQKESESAVSELWNLLKGKGPLEPLYDDPLVTDIFVTGYNSIKCFRRGHLLDTPFHFRSQSEYEEFTAALLQSANSTLSPSRPTATCVLPDKWRSRLSVIHASILDSEELSVTIRIPRLPQVSFYELIRTKTVPATVAAWLTEVMAEEKCSILVTGPGGSGKTTLASALLGAAPSEHRIITIEEVPELFPTSHHLEKLLLCGQRHTRELASSMVDVALRRFPNWLGFGELRSGQSPAILKALESGPSVLMTLSASSPEAALRILTDDVRQQLNATSAAEAATRIRHGIDLIITMGVREGRPFIQSISECAASETGLECSDIIRFVGEESGKRQWRLCSPGSFWVKQLSQRGHQLRVGGGLLSPVE